MTTTLTLDRAGNPLTTVSTLSTPTKNLTRSQSFGYDSAGRVTSRSVAFGGRTAEVALTYGPLGGVAKETFSNKVVRSYSYDCHGWATDIKTSLPMFRIPDDKDPIITSGVTGQFYGYGVVNQLDYSWNGMLLGEVEATGNGSDFVGRTGFPQSGAGGGTAAYSWTAAGLLKTDSARGISNSLYNRLGLPTSVTFSDKSRVDFRYSASGELLAVSTYAVVEGSKRPVKVSERSYCGDFVFEGDSLTSVKFAGGFFDGDGNPHFRHADWQGNVAMVTDADGALEQHVGYYPYGEPWREPAGQNRLFGGKERLRDGALNDYDFSARRLNSALGIWSAPDPLARDFASTNPYVYCAANPIRFIDPSGKNYIFPNITEEDKTRIKNLIETSSDYQLEAIFDGEMLITLVMTESLDNVAQGILYYTAKKEDSEIQIANSSYVLIGEASTGTIDLDDILNLGKEGPANDIGSFMHELGEQHHIQHPSPKLEEKEIVPNAHQRAIGIENTINDVNVDPKRYINDKNKTIEFRYNPDRFAPQDPNVPYPNLIEIKFDENNNILKR